MARVFIEEPDKAPILHCCNPPQLQDEEFGGFDDDDSPEAGAKETTGRWTREEHHIFIKGLELYGKAWKKIAMAIKTRTVVQIRTHAQKYFLKLSKARQNGDNSLSKMGNGKRRRARDRQIAISVPLQPFIVHPAPQFSSSTSASKSSSALLANADGAGGAPSEGGFFMQDGKDDGGQSTDPVNIKMEPGTATQDGAALLQPSKSHNSQVEADKCLYNFLSAELHQTARHAPEWYHRAHSIATLLTEAEKLDWSCDNGVAIPLSQVTNTSAFYKPTTGEAHTQMLVAQVPALENLSMPLGSIGSMGTTSLGLETMRQDNWCVGSTGASMGDGGMEYDFVNEQLQLDWRFGGGI